VGVSAKVTSESNSSTNKANPLLMLTLILSAPSTLFVDPYEDTVKNLRAQSCKEEIAESDDEKIEKAAFSDEDVAQQ